MGARVSRAPAAVPAAVSARERVGRRLRGALPRELSVGSYFAVATTLILVFVATLLVIDLAASAKKTALVAKRASAETVTSLFAGSLSAAIVFDDRDAIRKELDNLQHADAILAASVFVGAGAAPVATMTRDPRDRAPASALAPGTVLTTSRLLVTQAVRDREGLVVGSATVAFSLAAENRAQSAMKWSLAGRGAVLVVVTAAMLILIARQKVIRPLMALVEVANRIERGELHAKTNELGGNAEMRALAHAFDRMSGAIADRETRLLGELEVAAGLQTSILPADPRVPGLEIAAYMEPAAEVGGDYYDVIPTPDGCWLAMGDVSGHGLGSGVIMLMLQSAIASLVRAEPDASPSRVECLVNEVLFENVRNRMNRRDHATLSILRYTSDGTFRMAGAHEDIIVWRAKSRTIELVETPGTWVGAVRSIASATVDSTFVLGEGDLAVLYTDGITEARRGGRQLGLDAVCDLVVANAEKSTEAIKSAIVGAVHDWTDKLQDDVSVIVLRRSSA
jgi:serine phosphatase RsbU (regulator of sigma subunit)